MSEILVIDEGKNTEAKAVATSRTLMAVALALSIGLGLLLLPSGLPQTGLPTALLFFNLGVEIADRSCLLAY